MAYFIQPKHSKTTTATFPCHCSPPCHPPASAESGAARGGLERKGKSLLNLHAAQVKRGRSQKGKSKQPVVRPTLQGKGLARKEA